MKALRLALIAALALLEGFCSAGAPALAATPPAKPTAAPQKLLPMQPGEVIIRDPKALTPFPPRPPLGPGVTPEQRLKDTRTWA